jgi:plasmid stabilization system protein ParE
VAFAVIWTRRGGRSADEILESLSRIDAEAAGRLQDRINETVQILERHPYIGAQYERLPMMREILCDRYRIFYQVLKTRKLVAIHLIWHSSRDEPEF